MRGVLSCYLHDMILLSLVMKMIGIDIVEVDRMETLFRRYGNRFLRRVFADNEVHYVRSIKRDRLVAKYLAKQFAVKEAYIKAVGGMYNNLSMRSISTTHDKLGKPFLVINGVMQKHISISISDERCYAVALVLINGQNT
ncbi:MAG: holo-[acyl-carrier-protein] synthase [Candidatus Xenolissoclinum pacificiensis L6]|uniref:Holo-[acyl-carrier-protein] synthase n=1 Tax=Candidatus Xenolissoclinum pacificiensis L6 TaxID=1401685 RepID=W2V097_9RICK|nr:MAG: holo-[acyl-carrier-protein] synthase [Candidatus Xenolissoclinum pacificiensis L6]